MTNKKVSIIMPTYNDSITIGKAIESIKEQTYKNWELIIVDDGSTDKTKSIISEYEKNAQIKYIYQENQDQLNAILNGTQYITGEYVYIAHSDDLLFDKNVLQKCVKYMEENYSVDAIISDLSIIDKNGNSVGVQKVKKFSKKEYIIPLTALWLGRNLYVDVAFYRKEVFLNKVKNTYLMWNTPFWMHLDEKVKLLNVKKVSFKIMKYRISESNYINDSIGQLNVINGEIRTATNILSQYNIPFYKLQYFIFRVSNKLMLNYIPVYTKKPQNNVYKIINFILNKRFGNKYKMNEYLNSLSSFFSITNKRVIEIESRMIDNAELYYRKGYEKI